MIIVFIDNNLERHYTRLKEYLTNVKKVNSQFIESRKLMDRKRAGSIMFNIVEQINIKMGGANFYINLIDDNIIDGRKVYLIIGLESKKVGKDSIDYVLTCAYNQKLNRTHTVPRNCKDNKEDKEKTLNELMDEALRGLRENGHAPHPPNYVIIYRQGGNHVQNLKLLAEEVPIFVNYIKTKKEQSPKFKESDTKLTYICCNLKGDLKFFEENTNSNNIKGYQNPQSGLCVDEKVIQKDKYEFFIQPQFVNQGTATPCHYEILYQDYDEKNPDSNLSIEKIQNLSFQLSFYYWTWSGAVRVPGVLRLSTTALDYYSRCLNHRLNLEGGKFKTPGFI
jgi:aubergine-like protein